MMVAESWCGDVFQWQGLDRIEGEMNRAKYREILDENLLQGTQDLRVGKGLPSNRTTTLSTQPRQRRS